MYSQLLYYRKAESETLNAPLSDLGERNQPQRADDRRRRVLAPPHPRRLRDFRRRSGLRALRPSDRPGRGRLASEAQCEDDHPPADGLLKRLLMLGLIYEVTQMQERDASFISSHNVLSFFRE